MQIFWRVEIVPFFLVCKDLFLHISDILFFTWYACSLEITKGDKAKHMTMKEKSMHNEGKVNFSHLHAWQWFPYSHLKAYMFLHLKVKKKKVTFLFMMTFYIFLFLYIIQASQLLSSHLFDSDTVFEAVFHLSLILREPNNFSCFFCFLHLFFQTSIFFLLFKPMSFW